MRIGGVTNMSGDVPSRSKGVTTSDFAASMNQLPLDKPESDKVTEILQRYNLRDISHSAIQSMGKELYNAGAIDSEQYRDFVLPTAVLRTYPEQTAITEADRLDYVAQVSAMLEYQKSSNPNDASTIKVLENTKTLYERFQRRLSVIA